MVNKAKGVTLTELVIAIAIIGILASIAYPSYLTHITQARRADGKAALLDLAARLERFYSNNNTYAGATIASGNATDVLTSAASPEGWYTLQISAQNATSFTVQAVPVGVQASQDTLCQTLTYNSIGVKGETGSGTAAQCW